MGVKFGTGNKAAEKYQLEDAIHIFRAVLFYFECLRPQAAFLNTGLNAFGYYPQLFNYLHNRFGDNDEIQELGYRLASILEARLIEGGLNGTLDKTMVIFLSKVKFGYVERQHVQIEQPRQEVNYDVLSEDKLRELEQILKLTKGDESGAEEID